MFVGSTVSQEAGVPMVNISYCHTPSGSWDTHSQNAKKMKESLAPTLDESASALLTDLEQRGMLEETLVVINAEFGRTPKINKTKGVIIGLLSTHCPCCRRSGRAVFGKSDNQQLIRWRIREIRRIWPPRFIIY